jgi:hypothetical protein
VGGDAVAGKGMTATAVTAKRSSMIFADMGTASAMRVFPK